MVSESIHIKAIHSSFADFVALCPVWADVCLCDVPTLIFSADKCEYCFLFFVLNISLQSEHYTDNK